MVIVHFSFLGIPGCVPQSHFMKWEGELQECSPVAVIPGDERGRVAGTRVGVGTCLYLAHQGAMARRSRHLRGVLAAPTWSVAKPAPTVQGRGSGEGIHPPSLGTHIPLCRRIWHTQRCGQD